MKYHLFILYVFCLLIPCVANSNSCEKEGGSDCEVSKTVRVHIIETLIQPDDVSISSCHDLSEQIKSFKGAVYESGVSYASSAREFTSKLFSVGGTFYTKDNKELEVNPVSVKLQRFGYLDIDLEDWGNNPSLSGRNIDKMEELARCFLTDEVSYYSYDLIARVDDNLVFWTSREATDNQFDYDLESKEIFKYLYGKDGLGYGDYVRGGIYYKNTPKLFGVEWSYDQFSLIWGLEPIDVSDRAAEIIPETIARQVKDSWLGSCQSVRIRISSDPGFSSATKYIENKPLHCLEQPLFTDLSRYPPPDNNAPDFSKYLSSIESLHHQSLLLDSQGVRIPCDSRDEISFDGCSQKIVHEFSPLLISFLKAEIDLYIELVFPEWKTHSYRVDRFTGDVSLMINEQ
ncbi:hypothetical protein ACJJH9_02985 [Microbulbifer sp. DLAB2-AF]|uniref:hypothetical protein n=1 Tax=Microbulbifer sp. DLAB2-AF TaxID=3243395 RepID=UPI004039BEEE